ncbi:MAG: LysR family transcriptional regulator [Evtepia gabavorous]
MESARCKAFVTAAETGSFSKAGEVLGYTPSGVSQLVTSLERELGLPLLGRNRKGVTLTENGRRLLPAVREFLQQENRIYQLAGEMSGLLVGNVTIATYSSVATHWLPQVIRRFRARYPHIQIKLMEGIRQEIIQWLEDKAADLAFFSHKAPMPYDWIPLAEDRMVAVLPPGHPLADRGPIPGPVCPGGLHHARPGPGRRCSGPAGDPRSGAENCLYHPGHSLSPGHDSE